MRLPCEVMFYQSKLTIKCIFAFYQIYFCLLSNTALLAIKYIFYIKERIKRQKIAK